MSQSAIKHLNSILNNSINASNMYIGITPRMITREKEIARARLHIAHQIAMRDNCIVDMGAIHISEGKDDRFLFDTNFDYDDMDIDKIIESIEITDVHEFQELLVVIGKYSAGAALKNTYISRSITRRPKWIHDSRRVRKLLGNEYLVGIGIADDYTQYYRGFYVADIGAAYAIASEKETYISTHALDLMENNWGYTESVLLSRTENIKLEGFYILDRWMEPDGSKYYSLGIANARKTVQEDVK